MTEQAPATTAEQAPSDDPGTGYQIVADLLQRQDQVLLDLDALNSRVEQAIQQLADYRNQDAASESLAAV